MKFVGGNSLFLAIVGDSIDQRESRKFEEGLESKVKLTLYKTFGKVMKYLHVPGDAGSRLLFINLGLEHMG